MARDAQIIDSTTGLLALSSHSASSRSKPTGSSRLASISTTVGTNIQFREPSSLLDHG